MVALPIKGRSTRHGGKIVRPIEIIPQGEEIMVLRMKKKAKPERPIVCWKAGCRSKKLTITERDSVLFIACSCVAKWSVRTVEDRWGKKLTIRRSE